MNKRLLLKVFLLCVLFCQVFNRAQAQYAAAGEAPVDLQKSIYWLTWDPTLFGFTPQNGSSVSNIINGTYTWQYSSTVKITAVISNPTTPITQSGNLKAYTPGFWTGDGLNVLYKGTVAGTNGITRSALTTENAGLKRFDIAITVQILINGNYETVNYPGMVIGDAEALAYSATRPEYFSGTTNGPTAWQLLNLRVDAAKSLGALGPNNSFGVKYNQDHYVMDLTPDGKNFNIHLMNNAAGHDAGVQAVMFAHGASSLSDVTLRGDGATAISIGLVLPFDLGDAPTDYGRPENYITAFDFGSKPITPGTNLVLKTIYNGGSGLATLRPKAKAYMSPVENIVGEHSYVDADGDNTVNTLGTADNLSNVDDENALTSGVVSALNLKVNRGDNVTITIPSIVNNEVNILNQPVPVYLDGWIDFNNDKKFTENERATRVTIDPSTTKLSTNLVFPQINFTGNNIQFGSSTFLRLRLSKNQLTNWDTNTAVDDASISSADGGEIEDYKLPDLTGVVISGNVFHDADGAANGISGPAITAFTQTAYLVNNATNLILQKVAVSGTGSYAFTQVNNGTYRVVISSSNAATIGANFNTISKTLPAGWTASADGYGSFNSQGAGVETGSTPNLEILVTPQITGSGNDVTGVNFGINQHPVAVNDLAIPANTNTATSKNLVANDTDAAGGTVNAATVVIENPATPGVYAPTGFTTADGVYALDAATGVVTFTSTGEFVGTTTPAIKYKVSDNFGSQSDIGTFSFTVKIGGKPDPISTTINTPVSFNVKANDGDAANTGVVTVTPQAGTTANGATVVIDPGDPTKLKYTPTSTFVGIDTYTYTLTKNSVPSAPITVTVTVKPTGIADPESTPINTPVITAVTSNDGVSVALAPLDPTSISTPSSGTAVIDTDPTKIKYTPATDFVGVATYTYRLKTTAGGVLSDPITVTIDVKPVGKPDADVTTINQPVTTNVINGTSSGTDSPGTTPPSAGATTITDIVKSANALTVVASGNSITYRPVAGFVGKDTYTYRLTTSDNVKSDPITVSIEVKPTGKPDADITTINQPVTTNVINGTSSGTDSPGTTPPSAGATTITDIVKSANALTVVASGNSITYTPVGGFEGIDTYTYRLTTSDGVKSDPITVTINVVQAILAGVNDVDYVAGYKVNLPFGINESPTQVATDVLANDPDKNGATININDVSDGTNGTTALNGNIITYTPNPNFIGTDTYTYKFTRPNGASNAITVTIHVSGITLTKEATNANAIHQVGDVINYKLTVKNVGPVALTNVVITDAGADPNSISQASISSLAPNEEQIVTAKHTVTTTDVTNGKYINQANVKANDPKSPTPNDIIGKSDDLSIINTNPYDPTEVTITPLSASIALAKTGVLASSGNSINYTFTITNAGAVTLNTITLTDTKLGINEITIPAPAGGLLPGDILTYNAAYTLTQADKDAGTVYNEATVRAKDPGNNTIIRNANTTITVPSLPSMKFIKVADNNVRAAGEEISYTLVLTNTGNVTLTGIVISDPGADAGTISPVNIASLAPGVAGAVTITAKHTVTPADVTAGQYANQATATGKDPKNNPVTKVSDDPGTTTTPDDPTVVPIIPAAPASINLAKTGVFSGNQVSYTFIITNNGGVALNTITLTDTKLGLTDVSISAPTGGLLPNASLTYNATYILTQADKDLGTVSNTATVSAKDPGNNTVTGTGNTVTTVTTSPIATNDVEETNSGTPVIVSILTNDDPKGSTFNLTSIEIVSTPMHGVVVTNADGTVTYTPTAGYTGTDSFTYRVKDAFGYYTNVATVTVTTNLVVELKIPTLFSPNGDGVNDGFVIKDLGDYAQNELIVINRWGNEVYRQPNYQNTWSGTGLNEGTYFYIVRLKKANGDSWVIRKGYVTLIRTFKK